MISDKEKELFKKALAVSNEPIIVESLGFMSTSLNKQIAKSFMRNAFFTIKVSKLQKYYKFDNGYAYISRRSL